MNDAEQAIILLCSSGVPVEARAYGLSLQHHELADCDFAQCRFDNDSSISLSVNIDEEGRRKCAQGVVTEVSTRKQ